MNTVQIIENREIAPGAYVLTFRKFFEFSPGQVVKITTDRTLEPRMYSIASGIHDELIQILYDVKPGGELTNKLKSLKSKDALWVSVPSGEFRYAGGNAWWIASGTGIAPFHSMMRSGESSGIRLIHGVRKSEYLYFREEFLDKFGEDYIPCCTATREEGIFYGRVTDYLEQVSRFPVSTRFYLCGSAEMVVDVRDILIGKGVEYGDIFSEIYF